ncbi:MAG: 50S ribosomal protein L32 [bacterium]
MPNPKKRKTKARTNTRRSHHALKAVQTVVCSACQADILPHKVCPSCGMYKGKEVLKIEKNQEK